MCIPLGPQTEKHVKQLEQELREISAEVDKVEAMISEPQGEGFGTKYNAKQREEYHRLKDETGAKTAQLHEEMNAKKRTIRGDEPTLLQMRSRVSAWRHE